MGVCWRAGLGDGGFEAGYGVGNALRGAMLMMFRGMLPVGF